MTLGTSHGHLPWVIKAWLRNSVQAAMKQKVNCVLLRIIIYNIATCIITLHCAGSVTRRCINNNTWAPLNLSQCRTTKFTVFQNQIYEILEYFNATDDCNCTVESSINTDKLFDTLEIVTSGIIDTINTTIPILPNDIPVIVDILEAILRYTAVHAYTYISIVYSCVTILFI